jgi:hypothetical protein
MVTPMGWQNYFGFVCTPAHATCQKIERSGEFTESRSANIDDQELIRRSPLPGHLAPGRFSEIETSNSFPFPADMKK